MNSNTIEMYNDNAYVLILAILSKKEISVEEAFEMYVNGPAPQNTKKYKTTLTDADVEDMLVLKEKRGLSLAEIGDIYNMNKHAVHKRIMRYIKKQQLVA